MNDAQVESSASLSGWKAAKVRTLVDHVVDEILSAAARGLILPGERLIEKDLSASLRMSRVPIREALRVLESQGVVVSEPYKGIRMMDMSRARLEQILDVRSSLENLAVTRAYVSGRLTPEFLQPVAQALEEMRLMRDRKDIYGLASADTFFHERLVALGGNQPLSALWQSLARQLTVIIGLTTINKTMDEIVEEHERLFITLQSDDLKAIQAELTEHIIAQVMAVNLDHFTAASGKMARTR